MDVHLSIDKPEDGWEGYCGFVPASVMDKDPTPNNAIAITCGPPIMIKYVIQNLNNLGFKDEQIYTTIENKMKCGLGICGRCNVGPIYICKEGPVFTAQQVASLPPVV